jgi:hypothetical protein
MAHPLFLNSYIFYFHSLLNSLLDKINHLNYKIVLIIAFISFLIFIFDFFLSFFHAGWLAGKLLRPVGHQVIR